MKRSVPALLFGLAVAGPGACGGVEMKNECPEGPCLEGFACDEALTKQCLRRCEPATNTCIASEHCELLDGQSYGVCRPGAGGDPAGGD